MKIQTVRNGIIFTKDRGHLPILVQVGVAPGYSDVLHFYFPTEGSDVQVRDGHVIIRRKIAEAKVVTESK
jgi:hypothetical protein